MRSVLVAALLAALAVTFVHPALAQPLRNREDLIEVRQFLQRAPALPSSADTVWIGHSGMRGLPPFRVGPGPRRPGVNPDGMWDFDNFDGGTLDSMQGWVPIVRPNDRTAGTISDYQRPWMALDYGNRMNAAPKQGRTIGIVSAWHVDGGSLVPNAVTPSASPTWAPLAGAASAWCGLRAGNDVAYLDDMVRGGTGNAINGEALQGLAWNGLNPTAKNFPGYGDQWDQMLYRDVRVANGGSLTVSLLYQTYMSTGLDNSASRCTGWFDKDPLTLWLGNFISSSAAGRTGPIDSFMVYVGVPTAPAACWYTGNEAWRPVYDLKRRWFSEVIAIDKPCKEVLTTSGRDSMYKSTPYMIPMDNSIIQPMLDAQGAADGGGIVRIVFRVKTNKDYSDETSTGGTFSSKTQGAVRIDDVAIWGCTPAFTTSGFETPGEINNTIEPPNFATPGPPVGESYAFAAWHATGKPPKLMAHTHPVYGWDIGGGNYYSELRWADLCGPWNSSFRQCNIDKVVISTGDHDFYEAAGGVSGPQFQETRQGMMSPTINLVTSGEWPNNCGLDAARVSTTDDWILSYDIYAGVFDAPNTGNIWQWGVFSYPATQANGAKVWGDLCLPTYALSSTHKLCAQDYAPLKADGLIQTSNPSGIPDSIRLYLGREQRCISWGVAMGCSSTDGHYLDNISLGFPPNKPGATSLGTISADLSQWINDTFPFSNDLSLPGTFAFDTCAALLKTGVNIAPTTGTTLRFDVPGDTAVVLAEGSGMRVDLVFRILPGPGNYVVAGNRASGLRKVPTSAVAATPGDGSFWGEYMAGPGTFSKGAHSGGWNPNTWNSARCDTAELNIFPVNGRQGNLSGLGTGRWASMYHESDPKFGTLGILKNRCFLMDTLPSRPIDHTNITCEGWSVPGWLTTLPPGRTGYAGNPQTREFTKIIPDGLLTPGSHVEYFFRKSRLADPSAFAMVPDTEYIAPQPNEGPNYDGHRWQQFGVLPDRWKATDYGGPGAACILYVDAADRRGNEREWAGISDSAGFGQNGRHNGWRNVTGMDYWGVPVGGDPTIAVWAHGGQAGTRWDMYGVKGAETVGGAAGSLGGRLGILGTALMLGMDSKQGPTPAMLRAYYSSIFLFSGDLSSGVLGPLVDRPQDDVQIIKDFLESYANPDDPRLIFVMGSGFVESEDAASWAGGEGGEAHLSLLNDYLGVTLRNPSYFDLSGGWWGNDDVWWQDWMRVWTFPSLPLAVGVRDNCRNSEDVLEVSSNTPETVVAALYPPTQEYPSNPAGTFKRSHANPDRPWEAVVDGWDLADLGGWRPTDPWGRVQYFSGAFSDSCPIRFLGSEVSHYVFPEDTSGASVDTLVAPRDFMALRNNPLQSGRATVAFGLAHSDRVVVKVYDLAGRVVRTLAEQVFRAGEHSLVWDGTDDQGRRLAHGLYFTSLHYQRSGFHATKKLTILR